MRLNIRKVKLLIWVLCIAALGAAGWAFWTVYQNVKLNRIYEPPSNERYSELLLANVDDDGPPIIIGYDDDRQEAVWTAIIDGTLRPKPKRLEDEDIGPVTPPRVQVKPIDEVLEIGLIVHSGDPLARFAALNYMPTANVASNSKASRRHVTQGTTLEAPYDADPYFGEVVRIGAQEVVFSWGGEEVRVTPKLGSGGQEVPVDEWGIPTAEDPRAGLEEWPQETTHFTSKEGKKQVLIGNKRLEDIRTNPSKHVLEDVRTRQFTPAGGGQTLLELTSIEPESVAEEVGFESGDQIISVNGVPMSSVTSAINWYQANPNEPSYTIVFQRFGKIDEITLYPPN